VSVALPDGVRAIQVEAHHEHACVRSTIGSVYC
jgi:hypothetical protein